MRANVAVPPPAANGTTILIARAGHSWATERSAVASDSPARHPSTVPTDWSDPIPSPEADLPFGGEIVRSDGWRGHVTFQPRRTTLRKKGASYEWKQCDQCAQHRHANV